MVSEDEGSKEAGTEPLDIGSLFKGSATITLVAEIVSAIMLLGSSVAFVISRAGILEILSTDVLILLLIPSTMLALFIFLGAISFFVRFNRKIASFFIGSDIGSVDMNKPRVKTVVSIYGLAVGLILIFGMYGYWLVYKYFFAAMAATSLSFFGISLSLGIFLMAFLVQVVVAALGRTATGIIRTVLQE
jgi:hypothetical protein